MAIQYDDAGFIVGINKMREGIDRVHDDTQEIIQVLKSQMQIANTRMAKLTRTLENRLIQSNNQQAASNRAERQRQSAGNNNPRPPSNAPLNRNPQPPSRISAGSVSARERAEQRERLQRDSQGGENSADLADTGTDSQTPRRRERDSNGRFTSGSSGADDRLASKLNESIKNLGQTGVNAGGVDPVLDSLNEAKTLLSPLGRGAKMIGRGAKFSVSKFRSMKRREPLPQDQDRHNRENEKLLDKIWKAILKSNRNSSGFGGGLLGGRGGRDRNRRRRGRGRGGWRGTLGRLGELGGRGLGALGSVKGLGALAALAGAGSLAMDWGGLSKQEKTEQVGSVAGGGAGAVIGGVVGSLGGPIGTIAGATIGGWIGSKGGEVLATTVSPYISRWTTNLNRADLPKAMLKGFLGGLNPFFLGSKTVWGWFKGKLSNMVGYDEGSAGGDGGGSLWDRIKATMGFGGNAGFSADGTPADAAMKASDHAIQKAAMVSLGKCAEYVNNAFRSQGLQAQGNGKDVAGNLIALNKGKFKQVQYSDNYVPQIGDVMSMTPSSNSKNGAGHAAIYTRDGWVSDFKQGNKYGNTGAPSKTYYEDIKSGRIKPVIARMVNPNAGSSGSSAPASATSSGKAKQAMDYFMSQGWTKAQAAGIVGNLQKESQFSNDVISGRKKGDGGKAYGLAQWHPDRQANFKKAFGKSISQSTFQDQLKFVNYELTRGTEQGAGNKLKRATSAAQAGAIVSQYYERPAAVEAEKRERAKLAEGIYRSHATTATTAPPKTAAPKGSNIKAASSFMPASQNFGATPSRLPIIPNIVIPSMPKITERLDSGGSNKPIVLQASSDTISQNISDRGLAHAITGGLGQDRWG